MNKRKEKSCEKKERTGKSCKDIERQRRTVVKTDLGLRQRERKRKVVKRERKKGETF